MSALADAAATEAVGRARFGRLRLWGSLGFLLAVTAGGALLERLGWAPARACTFLFFAAAAAAAYRVPAPSIARRPEALSSWRALVASDRFARFLAAVVLAQIACGAYDAGFTLHLDRLGFGGAFIGLAYAVGVGAEVLVLAASPRLLARFRAEALFAGSIAVAAGRWAALALVTSKAAILALQPLHGITFGLWYAAAVQIAQEDAGAAPTAAQGLLSAAYSAGSVIGMAATGHLLAAGGGRLLYLAAAAIAAAATAVAIGFARAGDGGARR